METGLSASIFLSREISTEFLWRSSTPLVSIAQRCLVPRYSVAVANDYWSFSLRGGIYPEL